MDDNFLTTRLSIPEFTQVFKKHRTKKVNLVLISGKAGTGKTTAAERMQDEMTKLFPNLLIQHTAFAKPIKEIAYSVFHWDGNKDDKGRRLLQVIGTEAGREYNENIWVEYLENDVLSGLFPPNFVFVDDCRFPNEIDYFAKDFLFDITTIRIKRKNNPALIEDGMNHPSETSLPDEVNEHLDYYPVTDFRYNFVVYNDGTIEELYRKLDSIINYLKTKVIEY